jgi:mycothiol synthase
VGSKLIRLTEERALATAATVEADRIYLQNATVASAEQLYRSHGYTPVRRFRRMVADLDAEPAVGVPLMTVLRPLRPEDAREAHELLEEAFAEHWEHRARTFEEFERRTFGRDGFDPTLSLVAVEDGELVGASLNHWKTEGDWGWIGTIGVRPPRRGRGIGEALVLGSFAEFFRRGERRVALGVDVQNETGAVRLYERLGMRTFWEAVVYEKELRPGG